MEKKGLCYFGRFPNAIIKGGNVSGSVFRVLFFYERMIIEVDNEIRKDNTRSAAVAGTERGAMIYIACMIVEVDLQHFSLILRFIGQGFITAGYHREKQYVNGKDRCKYLKDHAANI